MQPGNSATDVQFSGKRRRSGGSQGEQMWHLPTKFKGYCEQGIILSDQTIETLTDLHGRLMALRREVYRDYHPPVLPENRTATAIKATVEQEPKLRMDDHLTVDTATRHHSVYFRLRFWNDGGGAITPEVRVTRVLVGDKKPADAQFSAQLPLLLPWSSLSTPPALTRQHTAGETVGVIGGINWIDKGDGTGTGFPVHPPLLYVAGAEHSPEIGQINDRVFVKIQAFVPGRSDVQTSEEWFWVQIEKIGEKYAIRSGHLQDEPD
jgi:hypothetical protein